MYLLHCFMYVLVTPSILWPIEIMNAKVWSNNQNRQSYSENNFSSNILRLKYYDLGQLFFRPIIFRPTVQYIVQTIFGHIVLSN